MMIGEEKSRLNQKKDGNVNIFLIKKIYKQSFLCICSKKLQFEDLIGIIISNFQMI